MAIHQWRHPPKWVEFLPMKHHISLDAWGSTLGSTLGATKAHQPNHLGHTGLTGIQMAVDEPQLKLSSFPSSGVDEIRYFYGGFSIAV